MSLVASYFVQLQKKIAEVSDRQMVLVEQAADVCAQTLLSKGVIHIYDTGHIISHELIARTGGLVAYTHLSFSGALDNNNLWRIQQQEGHPHKDQESEAKLIEWVFSRGTLQKGDVLIIGSVSGINLRVVELALQARRNGVFVIALTSPGASAELDARHPSGKRLFEAADLVLDNLAPYGDAFLEIDDSPRICPFSGISATILMWALTAGIVERLINAGAKPSIYQSYNLPGGPQLVAQIENQYREQGL